ncbi:MAG: hypothetical protein JXB32_17345 [Deltaproteobacteria bacterium]|nr:hypothetical protein [Deltaproteobacteria bacterium]
MMSTALAWLVWLAGTLPSDSGMKQESPEVDVVPLGDDGRPLPPGPEMTLEDEGSVVSTVRAVPEPAPAAESLSVPGPLEVRVAVRRVVAEQIRIVPIEIRGSGALPGLHGVATMGELRAPELVEPGVYRAQLRLPTLQGPAVILVVFRTDDRAGFARVHVWKKANLEIDTEPGARVRVEVAGETFGPVRAAGRQATVEVEIPPGAENARVIATDAAGNETTRTLNLPGQPFRRALVLPPAERILADDGPVLPVLVAVTDGAGGLPRDWSVEAESGAVGSPAEIQAGLRLYPWRPSRALGEKALAVRVGDEAPERHTVEMVAGPPIGIEIQAMPLLLPADGLSTSTVYAGVSDGLGHYIDVGPIEMELAGGTVVQEPAQSGPLVIATVGSDRMTAGAEAPAAIVVRARGGGHEGVVAIRQFNPDARGLRLMPAETRLPADGQSRTTVRVEVLDGFGEPLPDNGRLLLSALGGEVPAEAELENGQGTFEFRAGTSAGIATIRAEREGVVAQLAMTLDAGPPARLRAEARTDDLAGRGHYVIRARLEDRFGNGVSPEGQPAFRAGATRGSVASFEPVDAAGNEDVGWMEAAFVLVGDATKAVEVRIEAGEWFDTVRVEPEGAAALYLGLAAGYVHNLGDAGLVPLRLGVGWIDAFGARGFQFGAELGYNALRLSLEPRTTESYEVQGDALTAYLVLGYRWPVASWLTILGELGLGMEVGWFEVNPPGASPNIDADALVAFSVGARLVFGFPVGPGLIALQLAYDDARYDDLVRGNIGGLGGLLGYRIEL